MAIDKAGVLFRVEGLLVTGLQQAQSFSIATGEQWIVSGVSGTGKSQLLKALADMLPHQGDVFLSEQHQQLMLPSQWRQRVMYFAAETAWWQDRIDEHFKQLPSESLLAQLGLSAGILSQSPDNCSSGEKQRLALLRGLQYQPQVLLLDEVTANLDSVSALQVEALVQDYLVGKAVFASEGATQRAALWVSHDAAQCERLATPANRIELQRGNGA